MRKSTPARGAGKLTRRETMLLGVSAYAAMVTQPGRAASMGFADTGAKPDYVKDTEIGAMQQRDAIHGGKGSVNIKRFPFGGHSAPANFIIYDLPPGASEGVHVHHLDNRNLEGAFDEYYYIVSGRGQMELDGRVVAVAAGDHVHTPLDVPHGIENTHPQEHLKVFLTFIDRAVKDLDIAGHAQP